MNICLFTPDEISRPLALRDQRAEHLIKILHKKTGDSFDAGIIGGKAGTAVITAITTGNDPDGGIITFSFTPCSDGRELYPLSMIIGFPRPIQLKRLLRDIAGLGVCSVHLTGTETGEKSYMQSTLVEKGAAYRMLLDGTVQAASTHVPELFLHARLEECISCIRQPVRLALDNVNPQIPLTSFLEHNRPVQPDGTGRQIVAAIGSERGWSDKERLMLEKHNFIRCGMGKRVLRTETAATVAAAIILAAMGKLE
jgi:16S rRNA (uracil1498-N3)-methyltransferase